MTEAPPIEIERLVELDERTSHGLTVRLLWDPETDDVFVECSEADGAATFRRPDASDALDAFRHPFAYPELEVDVVGRS